MTGDERYPAVPRTPGEPARHEPARVPADFLAAVQAKLGDAQVELSHKLAGIIIGRAEVLGQFAQTVKEMARDFLSAGFDPEEARSSILARVEGKVIGLEKDDAAAMLDEASRAIDAAVDDMLGRSGTEG